MGMSRPFHHVAFRIAFRGQHSIATVVAAEFLGLWTEPGNACSSKALVLPKIEVRELVMTCL